MSRGIDGLDNISAPKIEKGCHAEALEACALGIVNYSFSAMYSERPLPECFECLSMTPYARAPEPIANVCRILNN